ncbi:lactate utilization protein C [Bacillus sp. ISL-4]|uniref:LutC/YkgG family protein n=1 Tax=Bacillus sp. ISL-4 TaxID=2819125 RepID=UPI001BE7D9B7|nr:lactate utilization protein C [Bacillus sp. ISL-4]MBT2666209.1 lactate utilization protein C [Bacillus sp. ISL-4]MBT2670670.1 lactate utilization protein C [Streptomyces sp. ISL-14]
MMNGTIHNEGTFLNNIAKNLGRAPITEGISVPEWKHAPQKEVLKHATPNDLVAELEEQCKRVHTQVHVTDSKQVMHCLKQVIEELGNGPLIIPKDDRFFDYGLEGILKEKNVHIWDHQAGKENIEKAESANIGITFSEMTLAESATVVLFSDKDHGRSISFLPSCHVSIIPKSTIVPRMTQAAAAIRSKVTRGEVVPSCINFITGPSNSADIEMDLVVGVHGPIKAVYIIVEDK